MALLLLGCLFAAATAVEDELSLLQLPLLPPDSLLSPARQEARLRAAMPLTWIHVPKCGSSFANFLVDLPGVCPGIPSEASVAGDGVVNRQLAHFQQEWEVNHDDGGCGPNIYRWGNHKGVPSADAWDEHYKNHAMIMLREPEQRLLSAYHYNLHSWPLPIKPANELQFALVVQGCTVRMLTRPGKTPSETCGGGIGGLPTPAEVQLASKRVRSEFAFVGLTDQWALSMCLGHRMFGGQCHQSDFVDTRIRRSSAIEIRATPDPWNTTSLRGFTDPYDGELYAVGLEVFSKELERFDASLESCQSCFEEAGVKVKT